MEEGGRQGTGASILQGLASQPEKGPEGQGLRVFLYTVGQELTAHLCSEISAS